MIIKNCGMNSAEAVTAAVESGVDYLGFILYKKSPRYVSSCGAKQLADSVPTHIKTVAVMVNPPEDEIKAILHEWAPDYIQLHGNESPDNCRHIKERFGIPLIKAIGIESSDDLTKGKTYETVSDILLLDTKVGTQSGGTGQTFDWTIVQNNPPSIPWFLAGGLNIENIEKAIVTSSASMIDVSSGLESSSGVKDPDKIRAFNRYVKTLQPAP